MRRARRARASPWRISSSSRVGRIFTSANSDATKNALRRMRTAVARRYSAVCMAGLHARAVQDLLAKIGPREIEPLDEEVGRTLAPAHHVREALEMRALVLAVAVEPRAP